MQRKASKKSRLANAEEKRFMAYTKESNCIVCDRAGPSIVHHCKGSTFKHNKILIGHWFVIPLCASCDEIPTIEGLKAFREMAGPQGSLWAAHAVNSGMTVPIDVFCSIVSYGHEEAARL